MKNSPHNPVVSAILKFGIMAAMLVCLPLISVYLTGIDARRFLEFPPLTRYVDHPGFSWPAFIAVGVVDLVLLLFLGRMLVYFIRNGGIKVKKKAVAPFPWWGWIGIVIVITGWVAAWGRFERSGAVWQHTFFPLWLGYILVINALCCRRRGVCPLNESPLRFGLLFPASAVFWWFFEYLNRYVQNWVYLGVAHFTTAQYIVFASISFSTVLPAVYSTYHYLISFTVSDEAPFRFRSPKPPEGRWPAVTVLGISGVGLAFIGVWPNVLFPLLWISPLLIITSLQSLFREKHIFSDMIDSGNWKTIVFAPAAALMCGFFWEMWNYWSFPKWEYAIPFVERFHIFEMPILGYGGYLPFGLECLVISVIIMERSKKRRNDVRQVQAAVQTAVPGPEM
ncbi:MAG: hypothetical protein R6U50_17145 [Desulfobacterales bacterium]